MSTPRLPDRSILAIAMAIFGIFITTSVLLATQSIGGIQLIAALALSGLFADALTAFAHFSFDYIFPYEFPIFGPIAREFNEHHECPSLDPTNVVENLTKGAYASCVTSLFSFGIIVLGGHGELTAFCLSLTLFLAVWALFFHQMHSYAHMGSVLSADDFNRYIVTVSRLPSARQRKAALRELFKTVPIPRHIRLLQRLGLTLEPGRHCLHHIDFESDFSSVNGWSDPFLNWILAPAARYFKARKASSAALGARLL